ncbi:LysE family translocator [Streptomyces netropsis]|uniref:Threonine/homoserine/homoserine lactone efflux protein n=1 Tax=Streptomyces netropsis TaxID=55404 RepID=A0A7W7LGU8_STRNE|nr:LysE family translocator [Streptomyces netropsis]MBB4890003.1 threonine/homoserine/homoserine lactone efflux protein [Streptomyces netropsis]GGR42634.1 amino acid transporter LysE [Streptomyces netropsis]
MTTAILGFALFSLLVTMAPGPDTLLVLRNCLRGGRRTGSATAVGAAVGSLAWGVAAAFGLAAALQKWDAAFTVVRLAGAAYLIALGAQALWQQRPRRLRRAARDTTATTDEADQPSGPAPGTVEAFRQGLLSCLLNPKVGVFFVAVVPQFLPHGSSAFGVTLLFGAIDAAIAGLWMLLVAVCAARLITWLRRPRVHRNLERTTGGVLVALGIGAAAESA